VIERSESKGRSNACVSGWQSKLGVGCGLLFGLPWVFFGGVFCVLVSRQNGKVWQIAVALAAGLFFGLIGVLLMRAALLHFLKENERNLLKKTYPDKPWKWRPDWANNRVDCDEPNQALTYWCLGLSFVVISLGITRVVVRALAEGNFSVLFFLVFPILGVWFLRMAISTLMHRKKHGDPVFKMSDNPCRLGGQVSGVIELPQKVFAENGFKLRLQCIKRLIVHGRRGGSVNDQTIWEDSAIAMHDVLIGDSQRTGVIVQFSIPDTALESSRERRNPCILWRLSVSADGAGKHLCETFELPVFNGDAQTSSAR